MSVCATIGSCDVQIEFGSMAMRRGCKVGWVGVGDGVKVAGKAPTFDRLVEGEGEVRCAVVRCGAVRCAMLWTGPIRSERAMGSESNESNVNSTGQAGGAG